MARGVSCVCVIEIYENMRPPVDPPTRPLSRYFCPNNAPYWNDYSNKGRKKAKASRTKNHYVRLRPIIKKIFPDFCVNSFWLRQHNGMREDMRKGSARDAVVLSLTFRPLGMNDMSINPVKQWVKTPRTFFLNYRPFFSSTIAENMENDCAEAI